VVATSLTEMAGGNRIEDFSLIHNIILGVGSVDKLGEVAKGITKNRNAVIVTDETLVKIGIVDRPKKSLQDAGFSVDVYQSPKTEPVIGEVKKTIDFVRTKDYGVVIGIGGGSAMDRAKAAAIMAVTPGNLEEYLFPSEKPVVGALPKIMLPTTSGAGSECSAGLVVTVPNEEQGKAKTFIRGEYCFADMALVDPSLLLTCPPRVTAGSGMDALAHNAEAVMCLHANPFSDALALKAVELVSRNLKTAVKDGGNLEARENMSWAASIGGMVCTFPWVNGPATPAHVVSEAISARYGFPHGESCGILLPFTFWFNLPSRYAQAKLAKIAAALGQDITGLSARASAERAITAAFDLLEDVGLPANLKEYGILENEIPSIVDFVLGRAESYGMVNCNPVKADSKNLKDLLEKAWEGRESVRL